MQDGFYAYKRVIMHKRVVRYGARAGVDICGMRCVVSKQKIKRMFCNEGVYA